MKEEGVKTEEELQSWFVHYMEHFFNEHGKNLIGWDEILEGCRKQRHREIRLFIVRMQISIWMYNKIVNPSETSMNMYWLLIP